MKPLFVDWHLGLGDAFVCNGLVRSLSQYRGGEILVPAKKHNFETVRYMFRDLPGVRVTGQRDQCESAPWCETLRLGNRRPDFRHSEWDQEFYRHAGVAFEKRWNAFDVHLPLIRNPHPEPFIFVHQDEFRGYGIDREKLGYASAREFHTIEPDSSLPFWDQLWKLKFAHEIHCIDSSFLNLVEGLYANCFWHGFGPKMYFHSYARPDGLPPSVLRAPWIKL